MAASAGKGSKAKYAGVSWEVGGQAYRAVSHVFKQKYLVEHLNCNTVFEGNVTAISTKQKIRCPKCNPVIEVKIGDVFTNLTVISQPKTFHYGKGNWPKIKFLCQCSCEKSKTFWVPRDHLLSGHTKSCGCYSHKLSSKRLFVDKSGMCFGRLRVLYLAEVRDNRAYYWCWCDCPDKKIPEEICKVSSHELVPEGTKSCGCFKVEVSKFSFTGSRNPSWRGGISSLRHSIRESTFYAKWRMAVLKRDNYTCQYSGQQGEDLEIHHIKPFAQILEENNITTVDEALACEELWDVSNGITLAKDYHSNLSDDANSFHKKYGTNATEQDFKKWFLQLS